MKTVPAQFLAYTICTLICRERSYVFNSSVILKRDRIEVLQIPCNREKIEEQKYIFDTTLLLVITLNLLDQLLMSSPLRLSHIFYHMLRRQCGNKSNFTKRSDTYSISYSGLSEFQRKRLTLHITLLRSRLWSISRISVS